LADTISFRWERHLKKSKYPRKDVEDITSDNKAHPHPEFTQSCYLRMLSLEEEYEIKDYLSKGDHYIGMNRHCRQFGI
jgi:hypothetical protein